MQDLGDISMNKHGYSLIIAGFAGFLGYLLLTIPGKFFQQYQAAKAQGQIWGYLYLSAVILGLLLFVGAASWIIYVFFRNTRRGRERRKALSSPAEELSDKEKLDLISRNIEQACKAVGSYQEEPEIARAIDKASASIQQKLETETLEIAAVGTVSSGKSTLLNTLAGTDCFDIHVAAGTTRRVRQVEFPGGDKIMLVDTPGLAEADGTSRQELAQEAAASADLVLFVIDGPLKSFEYSSIHSLAAMGKRILLCLNKQDRFSPEDQTVLLEKLREQLNSLVNPADIIPVQAGLSVRTVVRVSKTGRRTIEKMEIKPDISALAERMAEVLKRERRQLLLCNLLLQSRTLNRNVQQKVRRILLSRAKEVVHSYTWKAALAAAASPVPIVDVAAGLGFSIKMILDIAEIFERKLELSDAKELLNQLLKVLYASLGASALAPAAAQAVASGLKGMPVAGSLTGGMLQGITQAVITRWVGLVMIDYFKEQDQSEQAMDLQSVAMEEWKKVTAPSHLASLAAEALKRFRAGKDVEGRA